VVNICHVNVLFIVVFLCNHNKIWLTANCDKKLGIMFIYKLYQNYSLRQDSPFYYIHTSICRWGDTLVAYARHVAGVIQVMNHQDRPLVFSVDVYISFKLLLNGANTNMAFIIPSQLCVCVSARTRICVNFSYKYP